MDKTLNIKLQEFEKSLLSLEKVLKREKNDIIRDSAIKRFEYTFELFWKTTKVYLRDIFGVDAFSPKECFRELRRNQKITDDTAELLLKMTDDRNEIIHTYNEKAADLLYGKIRKNYYVLLKKVYKILKK